jgi:hypothetical protein
MSAGRWCHQSYNGRQIKYYTAIPHYNAAGLALIRYYAE